MIRRLALVLIAAAACQRGPAPAADSAATAALPEGHVPVTRATPLEPAAQVVLDSANARYSAGDYQGALDGYRRTLALAPGHPAPWFGISMAANMLGDSALADSARRLLESRGVKPETEHGAAPAPTMVSPHTGTGTGS